MAKPFRIDLTNEQIAEKTRRRITFDVLDDEEKALPGSQLDEVKLTLYNEADAAIINSRSGLDILGGNITVDSNGKGVWVLDPDDNPIVGSNPTPDQEVHVGQLDYQWDADAKKIGRVLVRLQVVNLLQTT